METARIRELLLPFFESEEPSPQLVQSTSLYLDLLLKWNARMNLTAVRDAENIVIRHFGESFFAARTLVDADSNPRVIDVGSGAGFPGVPIKMLRPSITLTLLEAHGKKATFLREVVHTLALPGVDVENVRAEAWEGKLGEFVTVRAVENFAQILPTAARLVGSRGRLALLIGESQLGVARQILPGTWDSLAKIPNSANRVIAVWSGKPAESIK